jgi:hypothetical protein
MLKPGFLRLDSAGRISTRTETGGIIMSAWQTVRTFETRSAAHHRRPRLASMAALALLAATLLLFPALGADVCFAQPQGDGHESSLRPNPASTAPPAGVAAEESATTEDAAFLAYHQSEGSDLRGSEVELSNSEIFLITISAIFVLILIAILV